MATGVPARRLLVFSRGYVLPAGSCGYTGLVSSAATATGRKGNANSRGGVVRQVLNPESQD